MQLGTWGLRGLALLMTLCFVAPAQADDEADPFYEGFFSGHYIYLRQADLSVGILSDAALKGVYEKDTALAVAALHARGAEGVQKDLLKVAKADDTDEEDAAVIKKMASVAGLVKKQADALGLLVGGDQEQAAAFTAAREATAKALAALEKDLKEYLSEE